MFSQLVFNVDNYQCRFDKTQQTKYYWLKVLCELGVTGKSGKTLKG